MTLKVRNLLLLLFIISIYMIEVDLGETLAEYQRKFFILFLGFISFYAYFKNRNSIKLSINSKLLIIYLIYITLTLFWSNNYTEGLVGLIGLYISILSSIIVSERFKYSKIVNSIFLVLIMVISASWVFYIILPEYTLNKEDFFRFKGITPHSGKLAQCAILGLFIFAQGQSVVKSRFVKIIIFLLFITTLLVTKMRSFITFYIIISVFQYFRGRGISLLLIPLLCIFFIAIEFGALDFILNIYKRGSGDLTDLTGRTQLWEVLISYIKEKPIFGYGYGAFKQEIIQINSWIPTHGHNLWLHQIYETGIVGNLIFQIVLVSSFLVSIKHNRIFGFSYLFYIILFIFLGSLTGLIVGGLSTPFYAIFVIMTLSEDRRIRNFKYEIQRKDFEKIVL